MVTAPRRCDVGADKPADVLDVLATGAIELKGRIPWSSNATFLVAVRQPKTPGDGLLAIYKPGKGERALWDFPRGLWQREVAAYQLDTFLGWGLVPPTVLRADGPMGPGSLQYCVDAIMDEHYFTLFEEPRHQSALQRIAAFDVIANNADRKAGHCLVDSEGRVWAIDNGLCFHAEPKLRTVIWDFAGQPLPSNLIEDLAGVAAGSLPAGLDMLLSKPELAALVARAKGLCRSKRYPEPSGEYPYPWPLI